MRKETKNNIREGKLGKEVKKREIQRFADDVDKCCQKIIEEGWGNMSKWRKIPTYILRGVNLLTKYEKMIYACVRSGVECLFDAYGLHVSLKGLLECAKEERWEDIQWLCDIWQSDNGYDLDVVENWPRFIYENTELFRHIVISQKLYIRRQKVIFKKISKNSKF